jgi:hypothetical protein
MGHAGANVYFKQPAVEAKGVIEAGERWIRFTGKSSTPKVLA